VPKGNGDSRIKGGQFNYRTTAPEQIETFMFNDWFTGPIKIDVEDSVVAKIHWYCIQMCGA